jgi:DNA-3-methyladenine glycosylase II
VEGRLDLEGIAHLDDQKAVRRLMAEYALLRGLGRLSVFLGDDVGARNNLRRWLGLKNALAYEGAQLASYGGLIYFHLLLDGLDRAGIFLSK